MLVKYKVVGSGGGYTLLFDESAGDANEKFAPSFRDSVFKPGGYGAASAPKIALANTEGQVSFTWGANYATATLANASKRTLRSTFKGIPVHLQVTVGTDVEYYPNAILASSSHDQKNIEVKHTLVFETDDVTATAP